MPRSFSEQMKSIRRSSAALLGVLGTLSLAFAPDAEATVRPAEIVALTNLRPPAALVDQSSTDRDQLSQETLPQCSSGTQFFDTTRQFWFDAGSGEYFRVISPYSRVIGTNCVLGAEESWVFRLPVLANQTAQLPATIQLNYVPTTQNPNGKSYSVALHQTHSGLEYSAPVDVRDMQEWKRRDDFGFRISVSGLSPEQLSFIFGFPGFEIEANQDEAYDGSPSPIDSSTTTPPQWIMGYRPASPDTWVSYTQLPDGGLVLDLGGSSQITLHREFSKDDLVNRGIDFGSDLDVIPNLSGIDWSIVRRVRLELLTQGSLFYEIDLEGPGTQSDNYRMRIAATTLAEWLNHPENSLRYLVQLEPKNFTGKVDVFDPVFWQDYFLEQGSHEASITDMSPGVGVGRTGEVRRFSVASWDFQYGLSSRDDTSVPAQVAPFGLESEYGFTLENPNKSSFAARINVTNLIKNAREAGVKHPELQVDLQVGGSNLDRSNVFLRLYRDRVSIAEVPLLRDGQFSIAIPADSLAEQLDTLLDPFERTQLDLSIWVSHDAKVEVLTVRSLQVVEGEPPPTVGERIALEAKNAIGEDTLTRIERTMAITSQKEFQILCKFALAAGMFGLLYAAWRYLKVYPTNRWLRDALVDLDNKGPESILDEIEKHFGTSEFKYDRVLIEVVNYLKLALETKEFENQAISVSSIRKYDQLSQVLHLVLTTKPKHHRDVQLRTVLVTQWQATSVQLAKRCEQNAQLKPQFDQLLRGLSSQASPLMHNLINGDIEFAKLAHRYM